MITAIAGVNGAGKSSIVGEKIRLDGGTYVNPDEITRAILAGSELPNEDAANAEAWQICITMLAAAIDNDDDFYFETTLGGSSVFEELIRAIDQGRLVRVFFVGLESPDLHIQRVKERVSRGGHHIPDEKIHSRWINSRLNMARLIDVCYAVRVFDNSRPLANNQPDPVTLFAMQDGQFITTPCKDMPTWAKPLAVAAIQRSMKTEGAA